jgi:hypothetical protein
LNTKDADRVNENLTILEISWLSWTRGSFDDPSYRRQSSIDYEQNSPNGQMPVKAYIHIYNHAVYNSTVS